MLNRSLPPPKSQFHFGEKGAHVARANERRGVKLFWERAARYAEQNLEAATIILSEAERYGGRESGLLHWAQLTVDKAANKNLSQAAA